VILSVREAVSDMMRTKEVMNWGGNPKTTQRFLAALEGVMWSLEDPNDSSVANTRRKKGLQINREYRNDFSYSYIHFFTKLNAAFAYGIIMGLARVRDGLVVNTKKWFINEDIRATGEVLDYKWNALMHMIHSIRWSPDNWESIESYYVPHLRGLLRHFNNAYIAYEKALIPWLMEIEADTRNFLRDVIVCARDEDSSEAFTEYLAKMNMQCNKKGHGRSDFTYKEVRMAQDLLSSLDTEMNTNSPTEKRKLETAQPNDAKPHPRMRPLLQDLTHAFSDARDYFITLQSNLLGVDPQLSNNQDLRKHCERFELAWERVKDYCGNKRWQHLSKAFAFLEKHGGALDPSSVEGCLLIPRLLLLSSWDDPSVAALFECFSPSVAQLMAQLRKAYPMSLEEALAALEGGDFMRELENVSLRLQRDQSAQWNAFLYLLFQSQEVESVEENMGIQAV